MSGNKKEKDYFGYLEKISNIESINLLDKERTDKLFGELMSLLPNKGKLYKYKPFYPIKKFQAETYDSLNKGYIYIPLVEQLNDELDTTLNFNYTINRKSIKKTFLKMPLQAYLWNLKIGIDKNPEDKNSKLKYQMVLLYLSNKTFTEISNIMRKDFGMRFNIIDIAKLINHAGHFFDDNPNHLDTLCDYYLGINNIFRKHTRIHSFASTYKQNAMWAYYCGEAGICIEYDLSRLQNMDFVLKRHFLQLQKVYYSSRRKNIKIDSIVEWILSSIEFRSKVNLDLNYQINKQLLVKDKSWKHEDEWRLFANEEKEKIFVDLVSSIIIDEKIINHPLIRKIISLSKGKECTILVRQLNESKSNYIYKSYF